VQGCRGDHPRMCWRLRRATFELQPVAMLTRADDTSKDQLQRHLVWNTIRHESDEALAETLELCHVQAGNAFRCHVPVLSEFQVATGCRRYYLHPVVGVTYSAQSMPRVLEASSRACCSVYFLLVMRTLNMSLRRTCSLFSAVCFSYPASFIATAYAF